MLALPEEAARSRSLTSSAKLVLARIRALSRLHGYCYATQGALAESVGLSVRQVRRILGDLESGGYIGRAKPVSAKRFAGRRNYYALAASPAVSADLPPLGYCSSCIRG
jgi:DNA-binding MarR family transcriptional regulator